MELFVEVSVERGVDRHLEAQACREFEIPVQVELVLHVRRELLVVHLCEELRAVGVVRMGDAEGRGGCVVEEVVHRGVDVVSGPGLHVSVRGPVVLELHARQDVVDACAVVELVGHDDGRDASEVPFGEYLRAERCVDVAVLEDVDRREESSVIGAWLVLVGVGETQGVVSAALEQARVPLGGHRREVLPLVVSRVLEVEPVVRRAAAVLSVSGIDRAGAQGRCRRRGPRGVFVVGVRDAEVQRVVGVDVPVHAGHDLVGRGVDVVVGIVPRVIPEVPAHEVADPLHVGGQRAVVVRSRAVFGILVGACQACRPGGHVVLVLAVHEEEELVPDDRASEGESVGVFRGLAAREVVVSDVNSLEVVVCQIGVGRTAELVVARTGHGVDGATGESALADVERRDGHRYLLECVERDGGSARREVSADAEGVVEGCAVDGHIRLPVVAAADGEAVRRGVRLRGEAHDVVHAAADRGHEFDGLAADVDDGSRAVAVHRASLSVGRHDDGLHADGILLERGVADAVFGQGELDSGIFDRLVSDHLEPQRVGASGPHVVDAVVALVIHGGSVLRARGGVDGDDRSADEGRAVAVCHVAADARGCHLCRGGRAGESQQDEKEKSLHKQ